MIMILKYNTVDEAIIVREQLMKEPLIMFNGLEFIVGYREGATIKLVSRGVV